MGRELGNFESRYKGYDVSNTLTKMVIQSEAIECVFCRRKMAIPIKPDWSSPLFVMQMEREHEKLKRSLVEASKDLKQLAEECVEAGVRPSVLRRADELRVLFDDLKRRFGIE